MKTLQDIEREFDKEFDDYYEFTEDERKQPLGMAKKPQLVSINKRIKSFYNKIILNIVDEMIGEEKVVIKDRKLNRVRSDAIMSNQNIGYNQKRDKLKSFKEELLK